MPISKKVKDIKEPLDIDLQLLASELDTSVNSMKYLSKDIITDAINVDAFDALVKDIESGEGEEVTSINDNTVLYEFLEEAVIVHTILGVKYVLFDSMVTQKIEYRLDSYK